MAPSQKYKIFLQALEFRRLVCIVRLDKPWRIFYLFGKIPVHNLGVRHMLLVGSRGVTPGDIVLEKEEVV